VPALVCVPFKLNKRANPCGEAKQPASFKPGSGTELYPIFSLGFPLAKVTMIWILGHEVKP